MVDIGDTMIYDENMMKNTIDTLEECSKIFNEIEQVIKAYDGHSARYNDLRANKTRRRIVWKWLTPETYAACMYVLKDHGLTPPECPGGYWSKPCRHIAINIPSVFDVHTLRGYYRWMLQKGA